MDKIQHTTVQTNGIRMHVASLGRGPKTILFVHGFPELWYSWRHQLLHLASLGYRCLAPDLRGYGDTDAPAAAGEYTVFHIVGDLVGLLDSLGVSRVFLVGHDWGAIVAWHFCLFRPDRVRALVNMSVPLYPRNPIKKPVHQFREMFGDDYYICRFQERDEVEADLAQAGAAKVIRRFLVSRKTKPPCIPREIGFRGLPDIQNLPPWLSEVDINYYASKFTHKGFSGGLNYYRCLDLNWELMGPWAGYQIKVPVKFIIGDQDALYHIPGAKEYIHSDRFRKVVPFLQEVVVMEGVAHFLTQERPDEVSAHIYDFINKF